MNIVFIVSSARKGNSYKMAYAAYEHFIKVASKNDNADFIQLSKYRIKPCTGCLLCDESQKCNIHDDMQRLIKKIIKADIVVFSSPTRWGLLSGDLKVFLDRLNPLAMTHKLGEKRALIFVVGQSEPNDPSINNACESIENFCKSSKIDVIKTVKAYNCLREDDILAQPELIRSCEDAIEQLIVLRKYSSMED